MTADATQAARIHLDSDQLRKTSAKWRKLPVKESTELKIWNVVEQLFKDILLLRKKDYEWGEICDLIEIDFKIKISPFTLQNYFNQIQKAKRSKRGKKKSSTTSEPESTDGTNTISDKKRALRKQRESPQQLDASTAAVSPAVSPAEISAMLDAIPDTDRKVESQATQQPVKAAQPVNDGFNNRLLDKKNL